MKVKKAIKLIKRHNNKVKYLRQMSNDLTIEMTYDQYERYKKGMHV